VDSEVETLATEVEVIDFLLELVKRASGEEHNTLGFSYTELVRGMY
jgi:hypothetical protein